MLLWLLDPLHKRSPFSLYDDLKEYVITKTAEFHHWIVVEHFFRDATPYDELISQLRRGMSEEKVGEILDRQDGRASSASGLPVYRLHDIIDGSGYHSQLVYQDYDCIRSSYYEKSCSPLELLFENDSVIKWCYQNNCHGL